MEKSNNNNGKLVGALLVGAAIGGILGVLFAPNKGSETRKKLVAKGGDLSDSIKEKINSMVDAEGVNLKNKLADHVMDHKSVEA